ncbi:MAG: ACT domain-containing protein [Planctomycetota bacterium]
MSVGGLALEWLPGRYAVCRLDPAAPVPAWAAPAGGLSSVTRTDRELSIVADEKRVPADVAAERGFVALRVAGTLDFALTGVLSTLTGALADAGVPVFVVSTFETDVLLVKAGRREDAVRALGQVADVRRK